MPCTFSCAAKYQVKGAEYIRDRSNLVFCDAPCSGSGSWRRAPDGKWLLDKEQLENLVNEQAEIFEKAQEYVNKNERLAWIICSVLDQENTHQIEQFTRKNDNWLLKETHQFLPSESGDGFFIAIMHRAT